MQHFNLKKKKNIYMYTFKCLLFALPVYSQTPPCAQGRACARVAHAGTFRHTIISLAGVKLSGVHIYTLKTTKTRLKNNTNGIKIGSDDDVVIIPMHLIIYIYIFIYQKILPQGRSQICP